MNSNFIIIINQAYCIFHKRYIFYFILINTAARVKIYSHEIYIFIINKIIIANFNFSIFFISKRKQSDIRAIDQHNFSSESMFGKYPNENIFIHYALKNCFNLLNFV